MNIECTKAETDDQPDSEFIFASIERFIETSNFPKKLLIKKLDMMADKYKAQLATATVLDSKIKENCEATAKGISELKRKNAAQLANTLRN